jgi:cytochrome c peroxidase
MSVKYCAALAVTVSAAAPLAAGIVSMALGAAVVGKPTRSAPISSPSASVSELKALYRRPDFIPFPKDNPYTFEKAALGKKLYFDTRLSAGNLLSCAACHNPAFAWGDGQPKGVGHGMKVLERRSPSIINAAFGQIFMWDGRAASLEEQALGPIVSVAEMNLTLDQLLPRIRNNAEYVQHFTKVFPGEGVTATTIAKAIATYERTIVSGRAAFDAWIDGNEDAVSVNAKRGFMLFNTKAGCSSCHSGWNFTDDSFHDIGLPGSDVGRGKIHPDVVKMQHAFKTPGLREIGRRAPYMHDGSLLTLRAVIDYYDEGGIARESRSDDVQKLGLSEQEKGDLEAFLNTLTAETNPTSVPLLPR